MIMTFLTAFQLLTSTLTIVKDDVINTELLIIFAAFIALEWLYLIMASTFFNQNNFEIEILGFLMSGIGLTNCARTYDDFALKQAITMAAGVVLFSVMLAVLRRTDIVMYLRMPVAVLTFLMLAANLILAKKTNGALNWVEIGGISFQPSEFVKLSFIFVGAASLDKLQSTRSLTKYLVFTFVCIGALVLMSDFGTALIFFFTFIIIAFMRSGDIRTIALVCVAAALGVIMILNFKLSATVVTRFSTYRHIWEHINDTGMQQTRTLIYAASGGLFGLGIGNGKMVDVTFSTTDLAFGMICEEWGLIVAVSILLAYAFLLIYAVKVSRTTRSSFYAIAACAAAGLILFQAALNVFGVTDIIPFTGITLPFISRGGSSIISSWGLLAFIKAADIRTYPNLSKTILPDHPLYPADVKIGRRTASSTQSRSAPKRKPVMQDLSDFEKKTGDSASTKNRTASVPPKPQVRKATSASDSTAKKATVKRVPSGGSSQLAQRQSAKSGSPAVKTSAPRRGGDRR